jgi:hypothetical protein
LQFVAVAKPVNATARGAIPVEGVALAVQVTAHAALTSMVPVCVQVWSSATTVRIQVKLPAAAKVWLGFWTGEVSPSPKAQAKVGVPVQCAASAVAENTTASPAWPAAGTVAVHVTAHGSLTVIVPVFEQFTSSTVAVIAHV